MDPTESSGQRSSGPAPDSTLGPGLIHEMRQPLMGIQAGVELLARELGDQVTSCEGFQLIAIQSQRLEQLMLGFKDLFAGNTPIERFALQPVVERAVGLLRFRLRRLGPHFALREVAPDLFCRSRPGALLHALTNLLGNAVDAVEQAGPDRRVEVRVLAPSGGPREIRVSDEGTGVAPAVRDRLFVDSITTKPAGKGTGLGLQVALEAMRRAGGTVRLVADADPGRAPWARTEFCIEVPADP